MSVSSTSNTSFQSIQSLNLSSVDVELLSVVLQGQQSQVRIEQLNDLAKAMEASRQKILKAAQLKQDASDAVKDVLAKATEKEKQEFLKMKDLLNSGKITAADFEKWGKEHGVPMPNFPSGTSDAEKREIMSKQVDTYQKKLQAGTLTSPALTKLIGEEFKTNPLVASVNSELKNLGIDAKLDSVESLPTVVATLDQYIQRESEKLAVLKEQLDVLMQAAIQEFQQFNAGQETNREQALALENRLQNFQQDLSQQELNTADNRLNPLPIGTIMTPDPLQEKVGRTIQQIDDTVAAARSAVEKMEQLYREHGIDPSDLQKLMENLPPAEKQRVESDLAEWKAQLQQEINDEVRRNVPEPTPASSSNTLPGFRGIRV